VANKFTIYYASDIHGSELLWRKFLNAGPFYGAKVVIMGGDLTGKGIVPLIDVDGARQGSFMGRQVVARNDADLATLEDDILFNGMYPYRCTHEEAVALGSDVELQDALFERLAAETVTRWLGLADERMPEAVESCFVMPGNDDVWSIDAAFENGHRVKNCDQKVIDLGDGYSLLSLGFSNHTPWNSPRELAEDDLAQRIEALVEQVPDPRRAVFNLHVPPIDTGLDTVMQLDDNFKPVFKGGRPILIPAGSTAVRAAIEHHQPLLGLHGHIHESKGMARIGRTVCVNPGSSYNSGQIDGAVIRIAGDKVAGVQFTSG
jgi:Icc-related predicted phosphoesterase